MRSATRGNTKTSHSHDICHGNPLIRRIKVQDDMRALDLSRSGETICVINISTNTVGCMTLRRLGNAALTLGGVKIYIRKS